MESEVFDSKLPITVLILTKNEENAIRKCLESTSIFQQVIVIDSNSSDSTVRISQEMGAQVINFSWNGRYPKKKQWSKELEIIENEWILYLDADERFLRNLNPNLEQYSRLILGSSTLHSRFHCNTNSLEISCYMVIR